MFSSKYVSANLKGALIHLQVAKEGFMPAMEEFRVTEYTESIRGIQVELYNAQRNQLFKARIDNPEIHIIDRKMCTKVPSSICKRIRSGTCGMRQKLTASSTILQQMINGENENVNVSWTEDKGLMIKAYANVNVY